MKPLVEARFERLDNTCSFNNKGFDFCITPGSCWWLRGSSGAGKTQTALTLLGLQKTATGTRADIKWNSQVAPSERAGMLFQNGVLIDSLTVSENITLAATYNRVLPNNEDLPTKMDTSIDPLRYLRMVGLGQAELHKMPGELSGGMLRRAALAQLLAQRKRLVLLDEPFTGLDEDTALGIIQQLKRVMKEQKTAFLLISHQAHLCRHLTFDATVTLQRAEHQECIHTAPRWNRVQFHVRVGLKLLDYFVLSLPLIILCFVAAGGAIAMLFGDSLSRTEVTPQILQILDEQAKNWPAMMAVFVEAAKSAVTNMANVYVPKLKASLFCAGMAHLVVLEIAPLLTALLLAGRIGGAYAGSWPFVLSF